MKRCNKCSTLKNKSEFYRNHRSPDMLASLCKQCKVEYSRNYRQKNLDECRRKEREYSARNSGARADRVKRFYDENPEKAKEYNARYVAKPQVKAAMNEYGRLRINRLRKECTLFKLQLNCRNRLHAALRGIGERKTSRTFETIGCSPQQLKDHLEKQFEIGMSWDNYGEWHVDHITPIAWGKTKSRVLELSHYSNLQPLWATENHSKGARCAG